MKRLELVANIAVIVSSVALLCFLGNAWYATYHPPQRPEAKALVGTVVKLPNVDFGQRGKTLLLAISPTCHFCRDSEPFYRQLANTAGFKTHLLAVLPVPKSEAETYVHASISPSLEIVSAPLRQINVWATPTLLLIDSHGNVEKAWVGKLDDVSQRQVQSEL